MSLLEELEKLDILYDLRAQVQRLNTQVQSLEAQLAEKGTDGGGHGSESKIVVAARDLRLFLRHTD